MHSNTKVTIAAIFVIIISGLVWIFLADDPKDGSFAGDLTTNTNTAVQINTNTTVETLYQFTGLLADVSGGSGFGEVKAVFENGGYKLVASFENLLDLEGGDYYEGWIVRNDPKSIISTGVVENENGIYLNTYNIDQDLTDHDFYVLTLEPDDGDPAPAVHILEGQLSS